MSEGAAILNEAGRGDAGGAGRLIEQKVFLTGMMNDKQSSTPEMKVFGTINMKMATIAGRTLQPQRLMSGGTGSEVLIQHSTEIT